MGGAALQFGPYSWEGLPSNFATLYSTLNPTRVSKSDHPIVSVEQLNLAVARNAQELRCQCGVIYTESQMTGEKSSIETQSAFKCSIARWYRNTQIALGRSISVIV